MHRNPNRISDGKDKQGSDDVSDTPGKSKRPHLKTLLPAGGATTMCPELGTSRLHTLNVLSNSKYGKYLQSVE